MHPVDGGNNQFIKKQPSAVAFRIATAAQDSQGS